MIVRQGDSPRDPEFKEHYVRMVLSAIEGGGFAIDAPLQFLGKAEIASEANRLGLDTALSWSCYDPRGDGLPCGLCDSCRLRRKGFADAGLTDGLTYPADT